MRTTGPPGGRCVASPAPHSLWNLLIQGARLDHPQQLQRWTRGTFGLSQLRAVFTTPSGTWFLVTKVDHKTGQDVLTQHKCQAGLLGFRIQS